MENLRLCGPLVSWSLDQCVRAASLSGLRIQNSAEAPLQWNDRFGKHAGGVYYQLPVVVSTCSNGMGIKIVNLTQDQEDELR